MMPRLESVCFEKLHRVQPVLQFGFALNVAVDVAHLHCERIDVEGVAYFFTFNCSCAAYSLQCRLSAVTKCGMSSATDINPYRLM